MGAALDVGDPAPDFIYTDSGGHSRRLAAFWAERPALVLWLRHFG